MDQMVQDETLMHVKYKDDIAIIEMQGFEKRLNDRFVARLHCALDEVIRNEEAKALILTSTGKFFCNGADLAHINHKENAEWEPFIRQLNLLIARVLTFPMPTIAAINGHTYGGGVFLVLACDYRIMRTRRGWIRMNEVMYMMRMSRFASEMVRMKLPGRIAWMEVNTFGKRHTAEEACRVGLIQVACEADEVLPKALEMARNLLVSVPQGFDRNILHKMKKDIYRTIVVHALPLYPKSVL